MPLSAQQIKEKLQSAIDQDANVVDMGHVLEAIHILEKTFIPKESLEETRLGKLVNDIRKKSTDRELTNRCRKLVRQWQKQHLKNSNGSSSNSPQASQRTLSSSAVAVAAATSKPTSSDAACSVQGGASTQVSVDKTNPANRKKRKTDCSSPRDGQPSTKLVKSTKTHDSNGIQRDSNRKVLNANLSKTKESKQVSSNQKPSKPGQSISSLSPSVSSLSPSVSTLPPSISRRKSPNVTSENAKKLPRVKSSNSLASLEDSRSSKSSPCSLKTDSKSSPALSRLKTSPGCSPKSISSPRVSNAFKDDKRNNTISPSLVSNAYPKKKIEKTSSVASSQSIFDDDSQVKTKSIFDEDDSAAKTSSIFDDDEVDHHSDTRVPTINDYDDQLSRVPSLFDDDDAVSNDATVYKKNNQDYLNKNSLLASEENVEDVSCSFRNAESDVTLLRTSPTIESNRDISLSSSSAKSEEGIGKKVDIFEEPVRIVTEGEIDRIHTTQWSGVNGCYDYEQKWHSWSDGYSIPHNNAEDTALHILPYVCLD